MAKYDAVLAREVADAGLPEAAAWPLEDPLALTASQVRALRAAAGNRVADLDFDVEDWSTGALGSRLENLIDALADYLPEMDGRAVRQPTDHSATE